MKQARLFQSPAAASREEKHKQALEHKRKILAFIRLCYAEAKPDFKEVARLGKKAGLFAHNRTNGDIEIVLMRVWRRRSLL